MVALPPPLRPVGTSEADRLAHVLVDGAARPTSALVLSHWPASPTPVGLARDTSAESALAYLGTPEAWGHGAGAVACDHLDEDGLAACFALAFPNEAHARAGALVDVARAGDFDIVGAAGPARAAWALRAALDPDRTPLAALRAGTAAVVATGPPEELFDLLAGLLRRPEGYEALWGAEEAAYRTGRVALDAGLVAVEEHARAALAVLTCAPGLPEAPASLGHAGRRLPLHPAVIHAATAAPRILVVSGATFTYYDRYETWVAYRSRALPARRDLTVLAARLTAEEAREGVWVADPPAALVPVLATAPGTESRLGRERVVDALVAHLTTAPGAWFPQSDDPTRPEGLRRSAAPRAGTTGRALARWRGRRRGAPSA